MNEAWYRVCGMAFSVFSAIVAGLVAFLSLRQNQCEEKAFKRVREDLPSLGDVYVLRVVSVEGSRRISAGDRFSVPDEGTLGSARSCDIVIPYRGVHSKTAFFWVEKDGLHMIPLSREGFLTDGDRARPGDEAILREGAELQIGKIILRLITAEEGSFIPLSLRLKHKNEDRTKERKKEPEANLEKARRKEIKNLRGKRRAEQRNETRTDKGKAARAKADARRTTGSAACGKTDGRKNPDKASGTPSFFRIRSRDRSSNRRI